MNIRRLLPDSLGAWMFTMVLGVVILVNGSALLWYAVNRDEAAAAAAVTQAADQVIAVYQIIERLPPEQRTELVERIDSVTMRMALSPEPIVRQPDTIFTSRIMERRLRANLPKGMIVLIDSRIDAPDVITARAEVLRRRQERDVAERGAGLAETQPPRLVEERNIDQAIRRARGFRPFVRVSVQLAPERWLNARIVLDTSESLARNTPFIAMAALTLLLAGFSVWGVRQATKPLALFSAAAERLGIDVNADPLKEKGPGEVRRAAHAFNTMQSRLKRFIQDRTQMLAAISHDLRTPITRLRLRAEFIDDGQQRDKMLTDLNEMEAMIAATLAFARDDAANEPAAEADVAAILSGVAADCRATGSDVTYRGPESLNIVTRPLALKRAVGNLVDNAVKYGVRARISLEQQSREAQILIDDDGPGIPEGQMERVFTAFYRIEGSRSRDTGGTGLGLTIARNAVRSMGGDVSLSNRRDGGLRVKMTLPLMGRAETDKA